MELTEEQERMWNRLKEPAVKPEIDFSIDGTRMSMTQPGSKNTYFYHLSTPWDIRTASAL